MLDFIVFILCVSPFILALLGILNLCLQYFSYDKVELPDKIEVRIEIRRDAKDDTSETLADDFKENQIDETHQIFTESEIPGR